MKCCIYLRGNYSQWQVSCFSTSLNVKLIKTWKCFSKCVIFLCIKYITGVFVSELHSEIKWFWCTEFLYCTHPPVTTRSLHSGPRDVWPLQALGDGEGHGREGQRFLHHRHCYRWGDRKHLGIPRPCATPGEPAGALPHPHLSGVCNQSHNKPSAFSLIFIEATFTNFGFNRANNLE